MIRNILILLAVLALAAHLFAPKPKADWSGTPVPADPLQSSTALPPAWRQGEEVIIPRARYELKAVVLSKRHYADWNTESKLSPYDLALGWGPMSDSAVINALQITQDSRWYNYYWENAPPIEVSQIVRHSANNHIIPADRAVLREVEALRRFDLVRLKGYLVDVERADGWSWRTSLTRDDSRGGSCELFWVEEAEVVPRP